MSKRISLSIPDKLYDDVISLSAFYKQSLSDTIANILDAVCRNQYYVTKLSKEYKMPMNPT